MAPLVNHSSIHDSEHASYDEGGKEASFSIHSVEKASIDGSSNDLECLNTPSSLGIFPSVGKFFSDDFLKVLVERILWWPSLCELLFLNLILPEDLPHLITVWVIRLDEPSAVTASTESDCVGTSWMLGYEFAEVELLTVNNPMVWIYFLCGSKIIAT